MKRSRTITSAFLALLLSLLAFSCASLNGSNRDYSNQFVDSTFVRPKPVVLASGTGGLVGKIVDGPTGEALLGAKIQVLGANIKTSTNIDGSFVISNIPAGKYIVQCDMIGFLTLKKGGVKIKSGKFKHMVFKLFPNVKLFHG